jgi:transposase InsO family protein
MTTLRTRRTYDHRIRELICETGDPYLFPELKIPRSTIRSWLHRGIPDVVTCDSLSAEETELLAELQELRHRAAVLRAIVGLLAVMLRVSERRLDHQRLPEGNGTRALLRAIERASRVVPLSVALQIARLSPSRYHGWRRAEIRCELDDRFNCPRSKPTRLTAAEVRSVKELVESDDHRHLSLRGLALYAQRIGSVVASPSTWSRLVRECGWRRPRRRLYPAKPKMGIRANAPNELWHIDVTIIRLLDGTKAYLHAVIDNFSRRILAWTLEERLGSGGTCRILLEGGRHLGSRAAETTVMTDSGAENVNGNVDALLDHEGLRRVLAQVEVSFSNSMIEAFWRPLRHAWLYLHNLDNTATLRRLIEFYVRAHIETMPHAAFNGQTPDEMYFGNGDAVVIDLAAARVRARQERMKANRMATCGVCARGHDFAALQLQRAGSRMS